MPKYVLHFKSGAKKEVDESVYRRFRNRVRSGIAYEFPDGSLMSDRADSSWDFMDVIPEEGETHSVEMVDAPTLDEVIDRGDADTPEAEEKEEPEPEGDQNAPILTHEEFRYILKESGLTDQQFAEKLGYSSKMTIYMAKKEGKISQPLSDKVREAFPPPTKEAE